MATEEDTKTTPLVQKTVVHLYEPSCMMQMDAQVAEGYVILLGGLPEKETVRENLKRDGTAEIEVKEEKDTFPIDESAVTLGFLALTEGNVIDACFGIVDSGTAKRTRGREKVQEIKFMLAEAAESNENIRRLAVETYRKAFLAVIHLNEEWNKLNLITICFRYAKIQHEAEVALKTSFEPLQEAIETALVSGSS